ncbi:phosphocholine-specific phospholipase C [Microlunatus sp. GCM10028923]|uniref:phosphocholine-specific phospholipase C n=1 Tax=Microlunatus sp. GCM10028923 TaxID=3273400 RepID=UPI003607943F
MADQRTSHTSNSSAGKGMTRRGLLKSTGVVAGLVAAGSLLPPSVRQAMAQPMPTGGLDAVEHVILLMQENRSFDHYFGCLRGVRGFGDRSPLRRRGGGTVFEQPDDDDDEDVLPFSLRESAKEANRSASDIEYLDTLPHGFTDSVDAWADGWYDRWVPAKGIGSMTYYDRSDLRFHYELADTFTILDAYHCSIFGSTNPNRNYFWTGMTGFEKDGRRAVKNDPYPSPIPIPWPFKDGTHPGYEWTTYCERLEESGVSWQIYQEWDNFTDNAVEYFKPFTEIGTKVLRAVDGSYSTTERFYDSLHGRSQEDQDRLLAQLDKGRDGLTDAERSLFDRAMYRSRPGTLLDRVQADIEAGALPAVVWIVPPKALSEHPGGGTPAGSANLVYDLLDVVASDQATWSSTATLINFDENDGYFDHVPPPVPPRPATGSSEDWYDGKPLGLGPRVPMIIVSPWTVGGFVDSAVADHTSTLRFLERVTGVREDNISAWRRSICSDLTSAFDFDAQGKPPTFTQPGPVPQPIDRWQPERPQFQSMPKQEPGWRPSRPTPYSPTVSIAASNRLTVRLRNDGDMGAAHQIYVFAPESTPPEHVWLKPGETDRVTLPMPDEWDIVVQGPDQYWHEAKGTRAGAAAGVYLEHRTEGRDLTLTVVNGGPDDVTLKLRPLAFEGDTRTLRVAAGDRTEQRWKTDEGWYDVELRCVEDETFLRRVTGRIGYSPKPEPTPTEASPSKSTPTESSSPTEPTPSDTGATEPSPAPSTPTHPRPSQATPTEPGPTQGSPTEPMTTHPGRSEPSPAQTTPSGTSAGTGHGDSSGAAGELPDTGSAVLPLGVGAAAIAGLGAAILAGEHIGDGNSK